MAVNLRATATLNTKPFVAGIRSIKAATESLNKSAIKGSSAVTSGVLAEKTAREATSRAVRQNQQAVTTAAASNARAINQTAQSLNDYNKLQQESVKVSRQIANAYQNMSRADANHYANQKRLAQQRLALTRATESGLEGPALQPYIDRVGRAEIAAAKSRATLTAATERQTAANNRLAPSQTRVGSTAAAAAGGLSSQRYLLHDLSRQTYRYALGMAAPAAATLAFAASWEHMYSSVIRTADPAFVESEKKVSALRESLVGMTQAMPTSFKEVTEIATLANQMGIATSQVADFTRAVAMFSATSGVSAEVSATAFGRLTSIMGKSSIGFTAMADSILKVGVNSVATEGEIINVTTQISSIAAQAKFSTEEMIGLSGALASVRVPPELSRGLITRVFGQIDKAVSDGGAQLDTLARISGRTASQFKNDWRQGGGADAFNDLLKGIRDAGPQARKEIESLGITSVRDVPVLLRLANAADSEGREGMLLTQTMNDAKNAAGETQRQYSIMADTVWSKLKVLGNNILAMFDEIGRSNLGGFGDLIENISNGLRDFTRNLSQPAKLLNSLELPWTNAEALGFITNLGLAAAGMLALGSAVLKVGAGGIAVKQLLSVVGGSKFSSWATGAAAGLTATGRAGNAAATGIAAATAAGSASRPILNSMRSGAIAAGAAWSNMGIMAGNAMRSFTTPARNVMLDPVVKATKQVPAATGALDNLVRFGLNPVTIALAAATTAAVVWADNFFGDTTDIKTFSNALASIDTENISGLDRELSKLEINGFWNFMTSPIFSDGSMQSVVTPFKNGVADVRATLEQLSAIDKTVAKGWVNSGAEFGFKINEAGLRSQVEGITEVDKAVQSFVDAGNTGKAVKMIQQLSGTGANLKTLMELDEGKNIKALVDNLFAASNVEMNTTNLDKFAKGTLPAVTDALYGVAGATAVAEEFFDDNFEMAAKFAEGIDAASASFINFGTAMEKATTRNDSGEFLSFDLNAYAQNLLASVDLQKSWQDDMVTLAGDASIGVIEKLAELGPEAYDQVHAIAEALRSEDPAVRQAGTDLVNALEQGVNAQVSGFGGKLGQLLADKSWLRKATGDASFADAIAAQLNAEDLSALREAGKNAGEETVNSVMAALVDGDITLEAALQHLNINIPIGADASQAVYTIDTVKQLAAGTITQMQLDALPALAEGKIWHTVQLANGTKAFIQVDAKTGEASGKVATVVDQATGTTAEVTLSADELQAVGKLQQFVALTGSSPAFVQINANDANARATANSWQGRTVATSYVDIIGRSRVSNGFSGGITQANGGIISYYANGGVSHGENHIAQIAPPNSYRVWGEAETEGEAYIPLARSKRTRSLAILSQVADKFGYAVTNASNVQQYANGGMYELQSRSRYDRMRNDRMSAANTQREINFTFVNPVERDWAEDAWEKAQMVGARL